MTLSREKMTLLFEGTAVSVFDWRESTVFSPGNGGLLHYYSGGSPEPPYRSKAGGRGAGTLSGGLSPGSPGNPLPTRGHGGDRVNGGDFCLQLSGFPDRMTLFRENLTPLFEGTAVSVFGWRGSTVCLPGIGGLLHSYSGRSAFAGTGGCWGGGGWETR